jgi:hypothetical protein
MNWLKRLIIRKETQKLVDNAIKESNMSQQMKSWLIGLANAVISALASGLGATAAGATVKQIAIIAASSAVVSVVKWTAQHPIPGAAQ